MASIIRIKRSSVSGNPSTLAAGELAYSALSNDDSNGGDRLYIGMGTETSGNAVNHVIIGGKYFTDLLDHTRGTLTASSALIVDADKKLDELKVDDLTLNGATLSSAYDLKINTASGIELNGAVNKIISGPYGGTSLDFASYELTLRQDRGGGISLKVGDSGAVTSTLTLNNDGSLSVPGTIKTLSSGDLTLAPNGTGKTVIYNPYIGGTSTTLEEYIQDIAGLEIADTAEIDATYDDATGSITLDLKTTGVTAGSYGSSTEIPTFTVDNKGRLSAAGSISVATTLSIAADTGTDANGVSILTETLAFAGTGPLHTSIVTDNTITFSIDNATTTTVGAASFDTANFTVTLGAVTAKDITLGSSTLTLGSTTTAIAGLTEVTVDNININGNTISSSNTDGNIVLDPNGTGTVNVSSSRITNVAEPTDDSDAATKYYVDAARSGLDVKASVKAATVSAITLSGTQVVDTVSLSVGDRVLVKDQADKTTNGIYVVQSGSWTRSTDADNTPSGEVTSGMFTFVEDGDVNINTGFVLTTKDPISLGSSNLEFALFSASGSLIAGNGLSKNGYTLEVNVAADGGIEISADDLQLKSSLAGDGLTYSTGVLTINGTADRISVSADAIDIASTYVGQTSITTLGTITTGEWTADTIATTRGGTGLTTYATGDILYASSANTLSKLSAGSLGKVLQVDATGVPSWADVDGGTY